MNLLEWKFEQEVGKLALNAIKGVEFKGSKLAPGTSEVFKMITLFYTHWKLHLPYIVLLKMF